MSEVSFAIDEGETVGFRWQISIVMGQRSQLWPDLPALESFDLNRAIYEIDDALTALAQATTAFRAAM